MASSAVSPEYLDEYIGDKQLSASISMLVIITFVYIFFNISQTYFAQARHWEIWTIYPLAYLASAGLCISDILMVKIAGAGYHLLYLMQTDPDAIVKWLKMESGDEILYMTAVTLPRIALCILYLRVFINRAVRMCTWAVIIVCALHWFGSAILAEFLLCQPYAYRWDKTIEGGWCGNTAAGWKYVSVPNLVIDVALILLPISSLYKLQMSRSRKIGIFITFMTGCLGIFGSVIRFVEFFTIDFASDLTYLGTWTMIYTTMEPCAYFVCACLPGTRPLMRSVYHKSGLREAYTTLNSRYGKSKTKSSRFYDNVSPVGKPRRAHPAECTTGRKDVLLVKSHDADTERFIRLQETYKVESSSTQNSSVEWDDARPV